MSRIWWIPSGVIVVLMGVGFGGAFSEVLSPEVGFYLFLLGVLLAFLATVALAGAAAFASSSGRPWRRAALRAVIVPLLVTAPFVIAFLGQDRPPTMNDVVTDLDDPPAFLPDVATGPDQSGPEPPSPAFRSMQREAYPNVGPLHTSQPPARTFARVLTVAREMEDWQVTQVDEARTTLQAVATSALFHFKDDVVIRVRPAGNGSRVDLRSRSRVGRGDMGANAARILRFKERFESFAAEP